MKKIKHFIKNRKILSIIIAAALVSVGFWVYAKVTSTSGEPSYVVAKAEKKDIVTTITGSGQVSASSQIDIKSKASGDLVYLNTEANGQQIKKGDVIAQVDIRNAEIALQNAKIAYQKLIKGATASVMLQAENSLNDALGSYNKSYDDGWSTISNTYVDLPAIMNGLNDIIHTQNGYLETEKIRYIGQTALDYQNKASLTLDKAKAHYDASLIQYKNLSRVSASSTIESFVSDTYLLAKDISESVKDVQNAVEFVRKQKNDITGDSTSNNISSWSSTINSDSSSLLAAKTSIITGRQDVNQKTADLTDLKNGADVLDIASQKLSLEQAQNNYDDYFVHAPFDGLLARLSVKATDTVSSGTIIGTLVSSQKISTITLNEVDVEKVHIGQKAKLTFDAVDGLTIDGTVITVDLVGTVTQGVVNYNVEISLDTQDDRVKSGMSVSASIVVDTKTNVLTVPNSAVKAVGKSSYVEMFDTPLIVTRAIAGTPSRVPPKQKKVEVGISNDSLTEIVSGINEGDQVVVRTISGTVAKPTTAPSLFGTGGRTNGGGTGNIRIPRN